MDNGWKSAVFPFVCMYMTEYMSVCEREREKEVLCLTQLHLMRQSLDSLGLGLREHVWSMLLL